MISDAALGQFGLALAASAGVIMAIAFGGLGLWFNFLTQSGDVSKWPSFDRLRREEKNARNPLEMHKRRSWTRYLEDLANGSILKLTRIMAILIAAAGAIWVSSLVVALAAMTETKVGLPDDMNIIIAAYLLALVAFLLYMVGRVIRMLFLFWPLYMGRTELLERIVSRDANRTLWQRLIGPNGQVPLIAIQALH